MNRDYKFIPEVTVSTVFTQSSTRDFGSTGSAPDCATDFAERPGHGRWNSGVYNVTINTGFYRLHQLLYTDFISSQQKNKQLLLEHHLSCHLVKG